MADLPPSYEEVIASGPPEYDFVLPSGDRYGVPSSDYLVRVAAERESEDRRRKEAAEIAKSVKSCVPHLRSHIQEATESRRIVLDKKTELEDALISWKEQIAETVEHFFQDEMKKLKNAFEKEMKRLDSHIRIVENCIKNGERLSNASYSLLRTGNEGDVTQMKIKLEKNFQKMNNIRDSQDKYTLVSHCWGYTKPEEENMLRRIKATLGHMDVPLPQTENSLNISIADLEQDQEELETDLAAASGRMRVAELGEDHETYTRLDYTLLYSFNTKTFKDKARSHPMSFTVTSNDTVIVPDQYNKKLKIFTLRGQLIEEVQHNQMKGPSHVTLSPDGELVVSDQEASVVHIFSDSGYWLGQYANMAKPHGLAFSYDGRLVVANGHLKSVDLYKRFDNSASLSIRYYEGPGVDPHTRAPIKCLYNFFQSPGYVAVDQKGNIVVSDRGAHCIQFHDMNGRYIERIGKEGAQMNQFKEPYGICIDQFGGVLVADYDNHRIQRVDVECGAANTVLSARLGLKFPTFVHELPDRRLVVSEYLTGLIKVFGTQDHIAETEIEAMPPPYSLLSEGPTAPMIAVSTVSSAPPYRAEPPVAPPYPVASAPPYSEQLPAYEAQHGRSSPSSAAWDRANYVHSAEAYQPRQWEILQQRASPRSNSPHTISPHQQRASPRSNSPHTISPHQQRASPRSNSPHNIPPHQQRASPRSNSPHTISQHQQRASPRSNSPHQRSGSQEQSSNQTTLSHPFQRPDSPIYTSQETQL